MTTLAPNSWRSVEGLSVITPLGIRFWDSAFDVQVDDGLTVAAYPYGERRPRTLATRTSSGVYALHGLPGLRYIERSQGNPEVPGSLPARARLLIEVSDSSSRFLPVAFTVDAPFLGLYPADMRAGDGAAPPGFYLFSAPTRPASPLMGIIRAQITERVDDVDERPASFAVLEIDTPGGDSWMGVADARGAVALHFPYPAFISSSPGSLPSLSTGGATLQSWSISARVRYQPSALNYPPYSALPEFRSIMAQAPAAVWTQRISPPGKTVAALRASLDYGKELILRSSGEFTLLIG